MTASIIENKKKCYFCRALAMIGAYDGEPPTTGLHRHHIMYSKHQRQLSEQYGLWIWLCHHHHNEYGSREAVHFNQTLRRSTERIAQKAFEEHGSREEWMRIFQQNYLEEDE